MMRFDYDNAGFFGVAFRVFIVLCAGTMWLVVFGWLAYFALHY